MILKQLGLCVIVLLMYAAIAGGTFLAAGHINLPFFWAAFAVQILAGWVAAFVIDPDLLSERMKPRGKDQDPHGVRLIALIYILTLLVPALDVGRFHISDNIPQSLQIVGVLLSIIGWAGFIWTMKVNRYFSSAIRLQTDRGQTVIISGPYSFVRHPGYATAGIAFVGQQIAFGSWLGLVPIVIFAYVMAKRTLFEENFLLANLAGYKEYFQLVKWRWFPNIW